MPYSRPPQFERLPTLNTQCPVSSGNKSKMNFRINFALLFLLFAFVNSTPLNITTNRFNPIEYVSIIELEEPCVRQGGICLRIDDCSPGNLVQFRGVLCPQQKHLDVECCYK